MDVNDGVGLGQLAAQAVILLGEAGHAAVLGQGGVGLAPALLRLQSGTLGGGALLAPGVQVGGVNTLFAQQCAKVARLGAAVGGLQDAALVAAGKLPAPRRGDHLRVWPHVGGRVSSRPEGVSRRNFGRGSP